MNAMILAAAMLSLQAQDVQATPHAATQLYVKTIPPGAEITVDGKTLGKSDGLFDVAAGSHRLTLKLDGYATENRSIDVVDGEITRMEVTLTKRPQQQAVLSYVGDTSDGQQSFGDSGHAVAFQRPSDMKSIVAVNLFASRYGLPQPPEEDFHVYLLDNNQKVLEQIAVPYRKIARGKLQWHTLQFPAIAVPEKFYVALWFNAEATKGVYLGKQNVPQSHSYIGLPDKGVEKVDQSYDWMIRAVVSADSGKAPTHPKVKTYDAETATDTESTEAQPEAAGTPRVPSAARTWSDSTGAFGVEASFEGVEDGKVKLRKADGKLVAVPLDRLSPQDRDFVAQQGAAAKPAAKPAARDVRELSHDNGKMASKSSIAGGGHAVRFKVEGDTWYVTSVSLHGSRDGEPRPPKEDFNVWICDVQLKPIATFHFPYSSYIRGNPAWKSFRVRPTRVPEDFVVCFGFNPEATKGVYVSYDAQPSKTSLIALPEQDEPKPFAKGNWLIRCKVEKRAE